MGRNKNRHSKDKLYISVSEHQDEWGGNKGKKRQQKPMCLPFNYCHLSQSPFKNPVCLQDGTVFDLLNILPYIRKYGKNPITQEPLQAKDLIKLHFHMNSLNEYNCPIMLNVFNENSYIVAVKSTGNVYSFEAINQLCIQPNNWVDLLTGQKISRKDLIIIQDPKNPRVHNRIYQNVEKPKKLVKIIEENENEPKHQGFTDGMAAASFTSTSLDPQPKNRNRKFTEKEIRQLVYKLIRKNKDKGTVILHTTHGSMVFQIHCDLVNMTAENFIGLCDQGYYNDTKFHRNIPGFMIQGGDPSGTGTGGKNIFNLQHFKDEFHDTLRHNQRGILSMANSGPNTNNSQFFITYRECSHLDNKHSVFGKLIRGQETLDILEKLKVNQLGQIKNTQVKIEMVEIIDNPFESRRQHVLKSLNSTEEIDNEEDKWLEPPEPKIKLQSSGSSIGKYIKPGSDLIPSGFFADYDNKKVKRNTFNFDNW